MNETVPLPEEPGDQDQPPAETRAVPAAGAGGDLEDPPSSDEVDEDEAEPSWRLIARPINRRR